MCTEAEGWRGLGRRADVPRVVHGKGGAGAIVWDVQCQRCGSTWEEHEPFFHLQRVEPPAREGGKIGDVTALLRQTLGNKPWDIAWEYQQYEGVTVRVTTHETLTHAHLRGLTDHLGLQMARHDLQLAEVQWTNRGCACVISYPAE